MARVFLGLRGGADIEGGERREWREQVRGAVVAHMASGDRGGFLVSSYGET